MYQGGSSRKQEPRLAIREPNDEPSREAQVRPHECPLEDFMVQAGFKDEFDAYVRSDDLEGFVSDNFPQYHYLTDSFVRRFKFTSSSNSHTVLFDLYDKSYTTDLEDFNTACKLPQWGNVSEPRKSEYKDFLANICRGTQQKTKNFRPTRQPRTTMETAYKV